MTEDGAPRRWTRGEILVLVLLPLVKLGIHLAVGRGWGWFRDELYYMACANRLDWGYVDHPPLSIAVLAAWRAVFGSSLEAVRALPAAAGALLVLLAGLLTRRFGGGAWTMCLAMLAIVVSPIHLSLDHFMSMNALELVFWAGAALIVANLLERPTRGGWLALGAVIGLGLLNKYSMSWFAGGLAVGLVLTRHRGLLLTPGPWLAGLLAGLIVLPHVAWEAAHGWPTREFMHNATTQKMADTPPLHFLADQTLSHNPLLVPLWLAGLGWLLVSRDGRRWSPLAWVFVATLGLLLVSGRSRPNYLTPGYVILAAAGAMAVCAGTSWLAARAPGRLAPILFGVLLVLVALSGAVFAPLALPILPVEAHIRYAKRLGVAPGTQERTHVRRLSQFFADQIGWESLAADLGEAWKRLSPEDRARARIFTSNYGQAGAVEVLGPRYGLPPPICGHNNYWLWGPGDWSGEVLIVYGDSREDAESAFEDVTEIGRVDCDDCMPYEDDNPIFLCRRPKMDVAAIWPLTREYQ